MTLDELAHEIDTPPPAGVPEWTLGTHRRRSISFATGFEDANTFVVWVQAHDMTGDLRVNPARPKLAADDRLEDLDLESLVKLASVEGGIATTSWTDGLMRWSGWIGFQPYDKYPEPGVLRRVGDCMIEFAPSGIYVEDWRYQESEPGVLAGLRLVAETGRDGTERSRAGGAVIAGDHAILALGRRVPLPEGTRAQDLVRESDDPVAALRQALDCTVDFAERTADGAFRIKASTDPRREGSNLALMQRLVPGPIEGRLIEILDDDEASASRLWHIDSLEGGREFPLSTPAPAEQMAWLAAEADTLIDPAQRSEERG